MKHVWKTPYHSSLLLRTLCGLFVTLHFPLWFIFEPCRCNMMRYKQCNDGNIASHTLASFSLFNFDFQNRRNNTLYLFMVPILVRMWVCVRMLDTTIKLYFNSILGGKMLNLVFHFNYFLHMYLLIFHHILHRLLGGKFVNSASCVCRCRIYAIKREKINK